MCGICGAVQIEGAARTPLEPGALDAMTDALRHRGPSDRGTYLADGIALGARRLSIVDVEGGHQPVSNEDESIWTVHNGELFNHLELRRGLEASGHRLASRCDTEVIPHLYEDAGTSFPDRLRGMFGIAIWDERLRRLVLVRDRLGIKPLYYARRGELLVFASELKALLQGGLVNPELDYEAIDAYLTLGFFPAPLTPLLGVHKLEPGHRLVVESGRVAIERYWAYPPPAPREMSLDDAAEVVLEKLEESVRLRLMSDVPLGAMLSGGLDSSLIVALMARNMSEPVKTFSVGFREDTANELEDARFVARAFGTEHTELELSFEQNAVALEDLVWNLDEPLADLSALGFHALCELASRDVVVALSGQGADELFGGYPGHRRAARLAGWQRLPAPLRTGTGAIARRTPLRRRRTVRIVTADGPVERHLLQHGLLDQGLRDRLYSGPLTGRTGAAARAAVARQLGGLGVQDDPVLVALHAHAVLGLPDDMLHYFDRMSMAHSLEVRVPFLDHELVELVSTIPARHKVRRGAGKIVLRQAARGIVPDRIVDRPKVGFFNAAVDDWLRTQLQGSLGDRLRDPHASISELLRPTEIRRVMQEHGAVGGGRQGGLLIAIAMLDAWLSSFLQRASGPAPERAQQRAPVP